MTFSAEPAAPVLLAVDEDPGALADVERELRDRYARQYRVVCRRSAAQARACLADLAAAGEPVALVLAGPELSGVTGSELLDQVRHLHPQARRGLLMPWGRLGDRATGERVFESISRGWIDNFVVRPSGSPDEVFHQASSCTACSRSARRGLAAARATSTPPHAPDRHRARERRAPPVRRRWPRCRRP